MDSDVVESAIYLRMLGPLERFFWRYTERNPTHFLIVAEFDGALPEQRVREALDAVQRRHPLLSAGVHEDPDRRLRFRQVAGGQIGLAVRSEVSGSWQAIAAEELGRPMPHDEPPLMRAMLVHHEKSSTLLLTFSHTIADGVSSALVLNDFLAAINGEALRPLAMPMSQEELVRNSIGPMTESAPPPHYDPRMTEQVSVRPFASSPQRVHGVEMSDEDTARLVARCREERSTVHGAIVTAASRVRSLEAGEEFVRTYSPIDIRSVVGQGENCVLCIGSACTGMEPCDGTDFWTQARGVNAGLSSARSAAGVAMGAAVVEQQVPVDADCDAAQTFFCTMLPFELLISNLGVREFSIAGPIRPRAVWGPIVLSQVDREQVIGVITYGGRLRMVCSGHTRSDGFLDKVYETLRNASR